MFTQFAVTKTASGARNIGHAPTQKAMPKVVITTARYMGLRVKLKGPRVTSLRFVVEAGLSSVPSRRNSTPSVDAQQIPATTSNTASGTSGRPGTRGHPAQ